MHGPGLDAVWLVWGVVEDVDGNVQDSMERLLGSEGGVVVGCCCWELVVV